MLVHMRETILVGFDVETKTKSVETAAFDHFFTPAYVTRSLAAMNKYSMLVKSIPQCVC